MPAIKLPERKEVDVEPAINLDINKRLIENPILENAADLNHSGQKLSSDNQNSNTTDESYPEHFDNQIQSLVNNLNSGIQTTYDSAFFEEAKQDLIEIFKNKGAKILSIVFNQSKISLTGNLLLIEVPTGYKNEQLDAEIYTLKHYFNVKLNGMDFELQFAEIKLVYKSEIPYSFSEKYQALLAENPQIALWFEKLSLMQY